MVFFHKKKREADLLAQVEATKSSAILSSLSAPTTFTDPRDGKVYRTVKIGNQVWMAENLNYKVGFFAKGNSKIYNNDPDNAKKYGKLYDWYTAMEVCPKGWHLPSDEEWRMLFDFIGGENFAGKKLKSKCWNGTDEYGFAALPGGYGASDGFFYHVGNNGSWWSATEEKAYYAYHWNMNYNNEDVGWSSSIKGYQLFSVRCVQNG